MSNVMFCRGVVLSLSFGAPYRLGIKDCVFGGGWTGIKSNSLASPEGSSTMLVIQLPYGTRDDLSLMQKWHEADSESHTSHSIRVKWNLYINVIISSKK